MSMFGVIPNRIFPHSDWIQSISPYSVQMRENADQNNSEYGHFFLSVHNRKWNKNCKKLFQCAVFLFHIFPYLFIVRKFSDGTKKSQLIWPVIWDGTLRFSGNTWTKLSIRKAFIYHSGSHMYVFLYMI